MFFNEEELLEIRLNELDKVVDKFVIVEAHQTFAGQDRELMFSRLPKSLIQKFEDKIIYTAVQLPYGSENSQFANRAREIAQRESIKRVLQKINVQDDDIVMVSDMDEIPAHEDISRIQQGPGPYVFLHDAFYYYVNNRYIVNNDDKWFGTAAFRWHQLKDIHPTHPRDLTFITEKRTAYERIKSGWHFSYLGGLEAVQKKILSFSAPQEWGHNGVMDLLESRLNKNEDLFGRSQIKLQRIDLDETNYPQHLIDNQEKFHHLILSKEG